MALNHIDQLLTNATAQVTGTAVSVTSSASNGMGLTGVLQSTLAGTGALTATVTIEVSCTSLAGSWILAGTHTLSGTTTATDAFVLNAPWPYIRANVTAITGTGATVNTFLAY